MSSTPPGQAETAGPRPRSAPATANHLEDLLPVPVFGAEVEQAAQGLAPVLETVLLHRIVKHRQGILVDVEAMLYQFGHCRPPAGSWNATDSVRSRDDRGQACPGQHS